MLQTKSKEENGAHLLTSLSFLFSHFALLIDVPVPVDLQVFVANFHEI